MPRISFTVKKIASLRAPDIGQIDYWDKALPGFGLRISLAGRKSWIAMYRTGRRKRRFTIGTYPPMALADARAEAKAILVRSQKGGDPAHDKRVALQAGSFGELAVKYIEEYAKENKKSWRLDEKALQRDVIPRLGAYRPADITRRDIRDLLDRIKGRGAPIQANRTFEMMRKLFNWAVAEDYLAETPCKGIKKPAKENRRDRVLKEDEVRDVWHAFEKENPSTAAVLKLRLITAQRGGEVMGMRWQDLDFRAAWWTIPGEFAKNGLSHRVPLSELALEVIKDAKGRQRDLVWVFPSNSPSGHLEAVVHATKRVRDRCGVEFVPHDLRRTAASFMTSMGIPRLTVKKLLNHVERDVTATYDRHSYDAEKKHALDVWAQRLEEIIAGEDAAANVVELQGGRR